MAEVCLGSFQKLLEILASSQVSFYYSNSNYILLTFIMHVYVLHATVCHWRSEDNCQSWFFLSSMWAPGIKLRFWGLATSTSTQWVILPPLSHFKNHTFQHKCHPKIYQFNTYMLRNKVGKDFKISLIRPLSLRAAWHKLINLPKAYEIILWFFF